jgi:hypothetical protein
MDVMSMESAIFERIADLDRRMKLVEARLGMLPEGRLSATPTACTDCTINAGGYDESWPAVIYDENGNIADVGTAAKRDGIWQFIPDAR